MYSFKYINSFEIYDTLSLYIKHKKILKFLANNGQSTEKDYEYQENRYNCEKIYTLQIRNICHILSISFYFFSFSKVESIICKKKDIKDNFE